MILLSTIRRLCSTATSAFVEFIVNRREHVEKWKSVYEVAGILLAVSISAASLHLSRVSVRQTQQSVEIAERSLALSRQSAEIQQKEFKLRNRPIVTIGDHAFCADMQDAYGAKFKHGIQVIIRDIAEIPANKLRGTSRVCIDGIVVKEAPILPCAISKAETFATHLALTDAEYQTITNNLKKCEVAIELFYSGMLGESAGEYKSYSRAIYNVPLNTWKLEDVEYR